MLMNLFPRHVDGGFRGHVLAIWILALVAFAKLAQGANVAGIFGVDNTRRVLEEVDRVPVGTLPPEAAAHLVFLFAAWGLCIFTLGLLGLIVLVRYRAMIPLMYLLFLIEQAGRKVLSSVHFDQPLLSLAGTPANLVNWTFLLLMVTGLALSLSSRGVEDPRKAAQESESAVTPTESP